MTRAARTEIAAWLAGLLIASAAQFARAQDDLDLGDDEVSEPAESDEVAGGEDDSETAEASEGESTEGALGDASEPALDAAAEDAGPPAPSVVIRAYFGAGATSRSFQRPISGGSQRLPASFVPAVEVGVGVIAWPDDAFALQVDVRYQSAVGLTVTQLPPFALEEEIPVRSERAEISIAPSWRLGGSPRAPRLNVPLGVQVRTLWPATHGMQTATELVTPGYSLLGPYARLELYAPLGGPLSVRLGPEAVWIIGIDDVLRKTGVDSMGAAIGGEATLQVALDSTWELALHYRESHAFVSGTAVSFEDVERYMTARIQGVF